MKLRKAPDWLVAKFEEALPNDPRVERRKMFGYPSAFVNGNLFAGLFEERVIVRLTEPERQEVAQRGGGQFAPMGRPMRDYAFLPAGLAKDDLAGLRRWLARGLAFAAEIPAKKKKTPAAKKKTPAKAKPKAQPKRRGA